MPARPFLPGEFVESIEQPVGDKVLHAMAQAYPDPVDLGLLSMVLGCAPELLRASTADLVRAGLARAHGVTELGTERLGATCITDRGMAVADGLARDATDAGALLDRLEATALRQLLVQRVRGSRLNAQQAEELEDALGRLNDRALVDAARVWAHQTVSDWRVLVRGMQNPTGEPAPAPG